MGLLFGCRKRYHLICSYLSYNLGCFTWMYTGMRSKATATMSTSSKLNHMIREWSSKGSLWLGWTLPFGRWKVIAWYAVTNPTIWAVSLECMQGLRSTDTSTMRTSSNGKSTEVLPHWNSTRDLTCRFARKCFFPYHQWFWKRIIYICV